MTPDPELSIAAATTTTPIHVIGEARGFFERLTNDRITGWAWDPTDPAGRARVELYVDDVKWLDVVADEFREDLRLAGLGSGDHAYSIAIPERLLDHTFHRVDLRFASNGQSLTNCPFAFLGRLTTSDGGTGVPPDLVICRGFQDWRGPLSGKIGRGMHAIHTGWTAAVAKADVDAVSYKLESVDLPPTFGCGAEYGLRLRTARSVDVLRIFVELRSLDHLLCMPFGLRLVLGNSIRGARIRDVFLGHQTEVDGAIQRVVSLRKRVPLALGFQDTWIDLPTYEMANCLAKAGRSFVVLEFAGNLDTMLVSADVSVEKRPAARVHDTRPSAFEDPVIEAQAHNIAGFFEVFRPRELSVETPTWSCGPLLGLTEVVVPVFNAPAFALHCVDSVLEKTDIPYLLTIVDDHSDSTLNEALAARAKDRPWVKLITNRENLGYTRAINKAIRESNADHVLFLNSDTEVSSGWLSRLTEAMLSRPTIGIVGPLSNAASWQSVPRIKDDQNRWAVNDLPNGWTVDDVAKAVSDASSATRPSATVLNGFCFMVRRKVFDAVGLFDEATFPLGYGEENDLCFRARRAGFDLVIADDTYVFHHKSKSFGHETRSELSSKANATLAERYGKDYLDDVVRKMAEHSELAALRARVGTALASIRENL